MSLTPSTMLPLGSLLPSFELADGNGQLYASKNLMGAKGLFVIFICNHCPYVKHINAALAPLGREFAELGVGMVAICSNDAHAYPADAPPEMAARARELGYTFPYLHDDTQRVAKAFDAACTPDLYLFDAAGKLVYRGQFDSSRPEKGMADGADIRQAVQALVSGQPQRVDQKASIGCNIKWR